jgi:hypothetical protein
MEVLQFPYFPFTMIKLNTLGTENSCFFHAILQSFHKDYINAGSVDEKTRLTRTLRNLLSKQLRSIDENGEIVYDTLSNGQLRSFSENVQSIGECSLENMTKILEGYAMITDAFIELTSKCLEIDIYILDESKKDIYFFAGQDLIKNRNSVVISWNGINHYSTIGIKNKNSYSTFFTPTHQFIEFLKERVLTHNSREK